tara:strand:- start:81839 stop:81985 length:147 start_codon:yes stop_codon:yes gene_type:complete
MPDPTATMMDVRPEAMADLIKLVRRNQDIPTALHWFSRELAFSLRPSN